VNTFFGLSKRPYFGPFNSIEPLSASQFDELSQNEKAAYIHDIEYGQATSMHDIWEADEKFIKSLDSDLSDQILAKMAFKWTPLGNAYGVYNIGRNYFNRLNKKK
jgi:hypothetical protein